MSNKITKKDIIADLHTHTVASKHAYSTIEENLAYAKKTGMKYIGITDHYFHYGDDMDKKQEVYRLKFVEQINPTTGIKVIGSAEFNILQDYEYRKTLNRFKWRPIGLHRSFALALKDMTYDDLFTGFLQASEWNNTFNHIERNLDELVYGKFTDGLIIEAKQFLEKVVCLAGEKNIYLEINEKSLRTGSKYYDIVRYWLPIAAENGNSFCLGTDAHFCREVGVFDRSIELLNEFGIGKDRVLNCNEEKVRLLLQD